MTNLAPPDRGVTTPPAYSDSTVTLHHGDCLDVLRELPDNSVDAVCTDPPYNLTAGKKGGTGTASVNLESPYGRSRIGTGNGSGGFMGKAWDDYDHFDGGFYGWCEAWSRECLRILKPGGHLLAFGGTRTWHRLACAVEDAGFEVRDSIAWLYGSGFPKSLNLVDEIGERTGWGTALKPAFEPIVVARKPLVGTVAANVAAHGTGALNIDACRVETDDPLTGSGKPPLAHGGMNSRPFHATHEATPTVKNPAGRWPANVVLDESQAEALDEQSGESVTPSKVTRGASLAGKDGATARSGGAMERRENVPCHGDSGGASRFFYVAREDEACLDDASGTATHGATDPAPSAAGASWSAPVESGISTRFTYTAKAATDERVRVNGVAHPTVKPLTLMRWLVRLVTPPGGTVLEPFAGSGTTVEACILEGFRCVAIEREADYLPLIRQRIHRRRDPVQAVKVAGDDGGLFDLLDGGAA